STAGHVMNLEALVWLFLPVIVAGGSALLSYYIMQAKMEVAVAKERESLVEARATLTAQKVTMEERVKATEEATKRTAMDDFMQDFRVEERSYVRDSRSLTASKKSMVMQERLFFRNIPLSNWVEHEMVVEEGTDLDQLPAPSVFSTAALAPGEGRLPVSKRLSEVKSNEVTPIRPAGTKLNLEKPGLEKPALEKPGSLVAVHASFGAQ
ncbi:MAG: hypothetical protein ACRD5L_02795, partial [Bryobacteraceae bacterium]